MVVNVHARRLRAPAAALGALLDTLSSPDDALWPRHVWPAMRLDRPLGVGARGGHGPIRYRVEAYEPGRRVRFLFEAPRGFDGFHELCVRDLGDGRSELVHELRMHARAMARLTWPLCFRWLHDALIEDAFDRAALAVGEAPAARWSWPVRSLRALLRAAIRRHAHR